MTGNIVVIFQAYMGEKNKQTNKNLHEFSETNKNVPREKCLLII